MGAADILCRLMMRHASAQLPPIVANGTTCLRFSQLLRRVQNKIDNYSGKLPSRQKEISGFDGVERFPAANPKQMRNANCQTGSNESEPSINACSVSLRALRSA